MEAGSLGSQLGVCGVGCIPCLARILWIPGVGTAPRTGEAARRGRRLETSPSWSRGVLPPSVLAGAWLSVSRWEFEASYRLGAENFLGAPKAK